jgi:hypothetical protein
MLVFSKLVRYIIKPDINSYSRSNPNYSYNRLINSIKIGICSSYGKELCVYTGYAIYTYNANLTYIKVYTELNPIRNPQYSYRRGTDYVVYTRYVYKYDDYDQYEYFYDDEDKSNNLEIIKYDDTTNTVIEIEYDYLKPFNWVDVRYIYYVGDFYDNRNSTYDLKLKYELDQLVEIIYIKGSKSIKYRISK